MNDEWERRKSTKMANFLDSSPNIGGQRAPVNFGQIPLNNFELAPLGSGVFLGRRQLPGAVPGQELVNTVDGMIGDVA